MTGPELWEQLHTVQNPTEEWFNDWLDRVPSEGCNCRGHFKLLLEDLPPDYRSRDHFLVWSWRIHNRVNSRLGKPSFKWREFVQTWRYHGKRNP